MVLVELFDIESPVDNILSGLMFDVERIVFVGQDQKKIARHAQRYQRIFQGRNVSAALEWYSHPRNDVEKTAEILTRIVQQYPDCAFDLSGGTDVSLIAAGVVQERFGDRVIPMYRVNANSRVACPVYGALPPVREENPTLTVEELIALFGGTIVYRSPAHPDGTFLWDWNDEFLADLEIMWKMCNGKKKFSTWNKRTTLLQLLGTREGGSDDPLTRCADMAECEQIAESENLGSPDALFRFIETCRQRGLVTDFRRDAERFSVTFKNEQVMECLCKAGTVWELRVFQEARRLTDKNGVPYYDHAMTGVVIDWDGMLHDERDLLHIDTRNEIDVIAMRGMTPLFLSCKNGRYQMEELYKLSTVADRFGGKYVRKALFASQERQDWQMPYLRARAEDMNIVLAEGSEADQIQKMLRKAGGGTH